MKRPLLLLATLLLSISAHGQNPSAAAAAANGPDCASQAPFYWEIGDEQNIFAAGQVATRLTRDSVLAIASASKWIYGAYVDQVKRVGVGDVKYLTLSSGWTQFSQCLSTDTVGSCAATVGYVRRTDGKFDYGGGHFQVHAATVMGMGALDNVALAATVNGALGTTFAYSSPQLAGGARSSTAAYVTMLQKMMRGELTAGAHLADNAVPTQGAGTVSSPVPEPWLYGRGHWIELDGTFSSPGAFGFYPWIHGQYYGVVARQVMGGAWDSVTCGRAIRRAFLGE